MHTGEEAVELLSQSINGMFQIGLLQLSCICHRNQIFIDILIAPTICTEKPFFFNKLSVLTKKVK